MEVWGDEWCVIEFRVSGVTGCVHEEVVNVLFGLAIVSCGFGTGVVGLGTTSFVGGGAFEFAEYGRDGV